MRLLQVAQPTTEGTAVVVAQLARAAVEAGHEVTVACPDDGDLHAWATDAGASWVELPMERRPGGADLAAVRALRPLLPAYDVVHLHSSKAGAVGRIAAASLPRRRRPPVVFTPHGWSWYSSRRLGPAYLRFERWAARYADATVPVSQEEYADGLAHLRGRGGLRLIENGIDTDAYAPGSEPREKGLLVCVGRLSEQKGQDRLLRAVQRLRVEDGRDDVRLVLAGDGPAYGELRELAVVLGISDHVTFAGRVDPVPLYRSAAAVVMPSRWEGLSIAMLEAMATGNAIVTTRVGGSGVLDGAGVFVDGTSDEEVVASLADQLARLLDDPGLRERTGAAARARAVERYSVRRVAEDHLALWDALARERHRQD